MSDVAREMLGDPYADLYDVDPYPAILKELKDSEASLVEYIANPDPDKLPCFCAPWSTPEADLADVRRQIADLEAKIAAGITTAVQDRARQLNEPPDEFWG